MSCGKGENKMRKILSVLLAFVITASVSSLPVYAEGNDVEIEKAESTLSVIEKSKTESDIQSMTIDLDKNTLEGDGKIISFKKTSGESYDKVTGKKTGEEKRKELVEFMEKDPLTIVEDSSGDKIKLSRTFSNRRIIVKTDKVPEEMYGAEKIVKYRDEYRFIYGSEGEAEKGFRKLSSVYHENVIIDVPIKMSDTDCWGKTYMNLDKMKSAIADKEITGKVTVAVIDSGINKNHAAFSGRTILSSSRNVVDSSNNISDNEGHGTEVASIIANSTPSNVQFLIIKVLGSDGSGSYANLVDAVRYATEKGADIINMSLGYNMLPYLEQTREMNPGYTITEEEYLDTYDNEMDAAYKAGITLISASGNDNEDIDEVIMFPAVLDYVIAVSSIKNDETKSSFSNYGMSIDFAAPGSNVSIASISNTNSYSKGSGTSYSSPYIAAAAATVKLKENNLSPAEIKNSLINISKDIGAVGKDNYFGYGVPVFPDDYFGESSTDDPPEDPPVTPVTPDDPTEDKHNIGSAVFTFANNGPFTYTGSGITPGFTLKYDGTVLKEGTDYTVTYKNNINAGTAAVTIEGKGNYTGTLEKSFSISPKSIGGFTAVLESVSEEYTGSHIKPSVTLVSGSYKPVQDKDYSVTYTNNTNVGTATVTIRGKGNYTDTIKKTFAIAPAKIEGSTVSISQKKYVYDDWNKTPGITVTLSGKVLRKGIDYTVSYLENRNIGTAKAVIKGKGNYTGQAYSSFTIVPQDTKITKLKKVKKKKTVIVTLKNISNRTGYLIVYSKSKTFSSFKVKKVSGNSVRLKIKRKAKYYIKARTYKYVNGRMYCSNWSSVHSVRIK